MFGTGLSQTVLSNLKTGRDPFAKRERKQPDPVEPRYSGLYVLNEGPADVLARVPEVVAGERGVGCSGRAEAEEKMLGLLDAGTKPDEIAVYRRRPVELETAFEVRIEGTYETARDEVKGRRSRPSRWGRLRRAMCPGSPTG